MLRRTHDNYGEADNGAVENNKTVRRWQPAPAASLIRV